MTIQSVRVAITMSDGDLRIMEFLTEGRGTNLPYGAVWLPGGGRWSRKPTDENIFHEVCRACPEKTDAGDPLPQAVSYKRIRIEDIPQDRTYRDAWTFSNGKIAHDMPRARELHRRSLRQKRVALFAENDLALRDAQVAGDAVAISVAAARRDALRDITKHPGIDAAQSVEDLKIVVLE